MKLSCVVVVVASLGACTKPNPRSCADGLCTDQAFPFCDTDGAFGGTPDTCIAVECTPQEFASCRGDLAVRCNATGNDYDLVECPRGCIEASGGCSSCTSDDQCSNPSPICDLASSSCRACGADDECSSGICTEETGSCVPENLVVYAAATGAETGSCTQTEPCSLTRAVTAATTAAITPTLRLLPGTYTTKLVIDTPTPSPLVIVASGAVLAGSSGMLIYMGSNVEIQGIEVRSTTNTGSITLGGVTGSPRTTVGIRDSVVAVMAPSSMMNVGNATVKAERVEFVGYSTSALDVAEGAAFEGDRLLFRPSRDAVEWSVAIRGPRATMSLTNSLLDRTYLSLPRNDTAAPGSQVFFAFNTFVRIGSLTSDPFDGINCDPTTSPRTVVFANNIFLATGGDNAFGQTSNCTITNNVIFPQSPPLAGNSIGDPQFVDLAANNFALNPTSPAIDTAVPTAGLSTDHDYVGVARPQGAGHDIGAFERAP